MVQMSNDVSFAQWQAEADRTGATKVAQQVYRRCTGSMSEQDVADKVFAALRSKGFSYILACRVSGEYTA